MSILRLDILGLRQALHEHRKLDIVQREINPLKHKGDNAIKALVRDSRKAARTKKPADISRAITAHRAGEEYAHEHGLPRLEVQIRKHMNKITKSIRPKTSPSRGLRSKKSND